MHDDFCKAVMFGNVEKTKGMVAADPEIVHRSDENGFTALHYAMSEDPNEAIIFIIDQGANVNAQNDEGHAPLHMACSPEIAKLLLDHGAEVDLQDNLGRTPLHCLAADGTERYEVIQFLLEAGANAALEDEGGETPVQISKSRQDSDIVELFEIWSGDLDFDFDD